MEKIKKVKKKKKWRWEPDGEKFDKLLIKLILCLDKL